MMRFLPILLIVLPLSLSAQSVRNEVRESYKQEGGNVGTRFETLKSHDMAGTKGETVPQSGLNSSALSNPNANSDMISGKASDASDVIRSLAERPSIQERTLVNSQNVLGHPQAIGGLNDMLSATYEDCPATPLPSSDELPSSTSEYCDEYYLAFEHQCNRERQIEVDANYVYDCTKGTGKRVQDCVIGREIIVDANHTYKCNQASDRVIQQCVETLNLTCLNEGYCVNNAPPIDPSTNRHLYFNSGWAQRDGFHPPNIYYKLSLTSCQAGSYRNGVLRPERVRYTWGAPFAIRKSTAWLFRITVKEPTSLYFRNDTDRREYIFSRKYGTRQWHSNVSINSGAVGELKLRERGSYFFSIREDNHTSEMVLTLVTPCCTNWQEQWSETCN